MISQMLVVLVLMLLNGVFAGAEIAVLSVRKTRLIELSESGRKSVRAVQWLRNEPERFLATVQIGITVVGTTAAAFGGENLAHAFADSLRNLPGIGHYASGLGLAIVIVGISVLEIVLGELVPKSLALRSAERYALLMGRPLRTMASIVKPAVWLLTRLSNIVLRLFGDKTSFSEARLSPEEVQELIEESARVGTLDLKTSEIASRALDFRELRAIDVMVPRGVIHSISKTATIDQLRVMLKERRHSRLPVYDGQPDNLVGYITVMDALLGPADQPIGSFLRTIKFIPERVLASDLLKQLQSERVPLSIVVDETGGIIGMVTIEDLLEEIVGEILSEHDPITNELKPEQDGSLVVPGTLPIRELNRLLTIELPEPEGFTTIAGLCLHLSNSIPETGTRLTLPDGTELEVLETSARRVKSIRVRPAPAKDAALICAKLAAKSSA